MKPRMKRTRQASSRRTPTMSIRLSLAAPGRSSATASVGGMRNHARTENGAMMMAIMKIRMRLVLFLKDFLLLLTNEAKVPSPRCE